MTKNIDEQVKEIVKGVLIGTDLMYEEMEETVEDIMLRIRPFLKVKKKWIGDAL